MRVVKDPSESSRRGNAVAAGADPNSFEVMGGAGNNAAAVNAAAAAAAGKAGLPLLPAAMFLLACAAGGVLVAVVRPLGLG
jgi:hypothetical protein